MIELIAGRRAELEALCRKHGVKTLEVFGSATGRDWDARQSDLDFLIEFSPDHDLGPWMREYFDVKDGLEKLFARPVDLVFATAMKNPYFIREVNRTRTTLYAA